MIRRTRHAAYQLRYHFVWVPKYRRKVLVGGIPERLTVLLSEKTEEMGGEIIDLTIQPDHVHLFCIFPLTLAPHQFMHGLKGYTAFMLRQEFPHLKSQLPNMWTRSYYVGTAGNVSAQTIQRYIDEQKGR
ncbi:MAG: IS200/IS605 family transposase [Anaerolineaceae bacterium]|nr:IS200/IS605 family transposase [Anaerolineaceae bacterium]